MTKGQKNIFNIVKGKKQTTVAEISRQTLLSKQVIHRHLKSLLEDGFVEKSGRPPKVFYSTKSSVTKKFDVASSSCLVSKDQIKKKILEAVENEPNKDDIRKVSLFGSYAYGEPKADSDVDVLIEFKPEASVGFFKFVQIQRNLGDFIGKKVDLLTPEALSKYFREEVLANSQLIYER